MVGWLALGLNILRLYDTEEHGVRFFLYEIHETTLITGLM